MPPSSFTAKMTFNYPLDKRGYRYTSNYHQLGYRTQKMEQRDLIPSQLLTRVVCFSTHAIFIVILLLTADYGSHFNILNNGLPQFIIIIRPLFVIPKGF